MHPGKVHFPLEDGDGSAQPLEHHPSDVCASLGASDQVAERPVPAAGVKEEKEL